METLWDHTEQSICIFSVKNSWEVHAYIIVVFLQAVTYYKNNLIVFGEHEH